MKKIDTYQEIINIFNKRLPSIFKSKNVRINQVQMAIDVADFLFNKSQKIMFVEAPVGTGKSLGLLVPTALYLKKKNKKSVYATATINLQNQIFSKDSVVLQKLKLLKDDEKILAQGQSHYTCATAFYNNINHFSDEERVQLNHFFEICEYGLFDELYEMYPGFDKSKEKYLLLTQVSLYNCLGDCPGHLHRKLYHASINNLVITNHDQLIQSYLNSIEGRSPIINYENKIIIVDEAHSLKETFLGRLDSKNKFNFNEIPRPNSNLINKDYREKYAILWNAINNLNKKFFADNNAGGNSRISLEKGDIKCLKGIQHILNKSIVSQILAEEINRSSRRNQSDKLSSIIEKINNFIKPIDKKWIEQDPEQGLSFHRVTLSFEQEFSKMINTLSRNSKIIFMSGTLTTDDPLEDISENWKLSENNYIYKNYPSIFNLKKQAIVYIPRGIARPSRENNQHLYDMKSMLPKLINRSHGGSLVLCTSRAYLSEVAKSLRDSKQIKRMVYSQNDGDSQSIGKSFEEDLESILVGSGAFFTGFSVEGKSLNKLFLSKLPYPVPTDAFIELISQGYSNDDKYIKIIVPMMLKKLEQAMGRLIRSKTDTGIITIFDPRIAPGTPPYKFIESLGYTITSDLSEVIEFQKNSKSRRISAIDETFNEELLTIPKKAKDVKTVHKEKQKKSTNSSVRKKRKKRKKNKSNSEKQKTIPLMNAEGKIRVISVYSAPRE